jgi:hypothetical protein
MGSRSADSLPGEKTMRVASPNAAHRARLVNALFQEVWRRILAETLRLDKRREQLVRVSVD